MAPYRIVDDSSQIAHTRQIRGFSLIDSNVKSTNNGSLQGACYFMTLMLDGGEV